MSVDPAESVDGPVQLTVAEELLVPIGRAGPGVRALIPGTVVRAGDVLVRETDAPADGREAGPQAAPGPAVAGFTVPEFTAADSAVPGAAVSGRAVPGGAVSGLAVAGGADWPWPAPHAPTGGTVSGEREVRLSSGETVRAVVLQTAGVSHEPSPRVVSGPFSEQLQELAGQAMSAEMPRRVAEFAQLLSGLGVCADRPTCPDLHGQLLSGAKVDTVVCSVMDPDPHLGVCARLADEAGADLVMGAAVTAMRLGASSLMMVVEPTVSPRAKREIARLARVITRTLDRRPTDRRPTDPAQNERAGRDGKAGAAPVRLSARAVAYANHYPRGDTSILLLRVLNRRLPPGRLPTEQGVVLLDAPAAVAIGRAVRSGAPMTQVPLGVADHVSERSTRRTHLVKVPVGTPIRHVLRALGLPGDGEIRTGEVLQERVTSPDAVISSCDLYLHVLPAVEPAKLRPPDPCIRCGWCVEACPTRVHPAMALEASQTVDPMLAERANIGACVECGLCQYVCPSRLPLLGAIREIIRVTRGTATNASGLALPVVRGGREGP